jgi:hypothetical protein
MKQTYLDTHMRIELRTWIRIKSMLAVQASSLRFERWMDQTRKYIKNHQRHKAEGL